MTPASPQHLKAFPRLQCLSIPLPEGVCRLPRKPVSEAFKAPQSYRIFSRKPSEPARDSGPGYRLFNQVPAQSHVAAFLKPIQRWAT